MTIQASELQLKRLVQFAAHGYEPLERDPNDGMVSLRRQEGGTTYYASVDADGTVHDRQDTLNLED